MHAMADNVRWYRGGQCWAVREQARSYRTYRTYRISTALSLEGFQRNIRTRRTPRSGGRVESEFQGLSGMDAARAAMGQGWPVAACPWNCDGPRAFFA